MAEAPCDSASLALMGVDKTNYRVKVVWICRTLIDELLAPCLLEGEEAATTHVGANNVAEHGRFGHVVCLVSRYRDAGGEGRQER